MNSPWITLLAWLKRVECRLDGWAATKLTAEEYADAVVLDRQMKSNFGRYFLRFCLATAGVTLVVMALFPNLSWVRALVYSGAGLIYLAICASSAWYGYRKWANKPAWKVVATIVALMFAGFAVGILASNFQTGKSLADMSWEKLQRGIALALTLGLGMSMVLIVIAHLRKREVVLRAERLQAEAESERLARQSLQAELKLLQAQVEPHFLFNTLANLRYLVQVNSPDALLMLDHLIRYLRTALPEIRAEGSTFAREAELARAYLEIMRIRMGGALEFTIEVPPDLCAHTFPPLMLITLVENAVKHGITPEGRGRIAIRVRRDGELLKVEVEDDGRGLAEPIGRGVGLANIRERLAALFGARARLALAGRDTAGTLATIEVPA